MPARQPPGLAAEPPPDEVIRADWGKFSRLATLTDHWRRPSWPDGAEAVYWLIPAGDHSGLQALAATCQDGLADVPDFDLVPLELLHLTLGRVGSAHDVDERQAEALADAASARVANFGRIHVSVGPLAGSPGALSFSVTPWRDLRRLHQQLVEASSSVLGNVHSRDLRPHVSIAYNARERPAAPVISAVRQLRGDIRVALTVSEVQLVRLVRQGHVYRWATLARVPLQGSHPAP